MVRSSEFELGFHSRFTYTRVSLGFVVALSCYLLIEPEASLIIVVG